MAHRDSVDYVIVGAGSAGCVLANRLTEDAGVTVALLEAGKPDRHPWLRLPLKFYHLAYELRFNWGYDSEPESAMDGRSIPIPRGKVLGGSSSINGMIYSRGHPSDYDQWRQMGLAGWGFDDVLPYFKKSEHYVPGGDAYHGTGGPLIVTKGDTGTAAHRGYMAAAHAAGFPVTEDLHGDAPEGFGPPEFTVDTRGRRTSAARTFLRQALGRPGLRVETEALVARIDIENGRAVGVTYRRDGQVRSLRAEREVILCGGAINSPHLLMLSGIGPPDHLRRHGIDVIVESHDVGQNLQDHIGSPVGYRCTDPGFAYERLLRIDRMTVNVLRWALFGSGPLARLPLPVLAYLRTRPEFDRPDIEFLLRLLAPNSRLWFPGLMGPVGPQVGAVAILLHPESRGEVTLRSADPADKPRLLHNYLSTHTDRLSLRDGIRAARRLFAQPPFDRIAGEELVPGTDVESDEAIDAHVRRTATTIYHPVGTCRMGEDPASVVDGALRLRGLDGLRVADASVMPTLIGGHTNAPTIMVAEKAADMIRGRDPLPAEGTGR